MSSGVAPVALETAVMISFSCVCFGRFFTTARCVDTDAGLWAFSVGLLKASFGQGLRAVSTSF